MYGMMRIGMSANRIRFNILLMRMSCHLQIYCTREEQVMGNIQSPGKGNNNKRTKNPVCKCLQGNLLF